MCRLVGLNLRGVGEHDRHQIVRCRRAIDRPGETLANQVRQVAAMINVGMAQEDGVDIGGREGEMEVALVDLLATAEHQAAVEEDSRVGGFQEMHRAGDRLRSAMKSDMDAKCGAIAKHIGYYTVRGRV